MTSNADTKFGSLSWGEIVSDSIDCPSSRSGHSLTYFEGNLYLFGGKDEYSASNELWQYHTEARVWTKLTCSGPKPPRLYNHAAVLYDRKIFIFGGSVGSNFSLWVFDFDVYEWSFYQGDENWPSNRHSQSVAVLNNQAYMFGGYTFLGTECNELWCYEFDENYWKEIKVASGDKPSSMFGHTAVFNGPVMWLYGGSHQREVTSSLWSFDTETTKWKEYIRNFSPPGLYYHAAIVTGDVMLIHGGMDEEIKPFTGMWRFNFETAEWTQMVSTELPPLSGHAIAVSYVKSTDLQHAIFHNNNSDNVTSYQRGNTAVTALNNNNSSANSSFDNTAVDNTAVDNTAVDNTAVDNTTVDNTADNNLVRSVEMMNGNSTPQAMFPVTPGDIELRPLTTQSTISSAVVRFQHSNDSHYSLPGMVLDENTSPPPATSPPQPRLHHAVYQNKNVASQLNVPGFCVNNPLYDDANVTSEISRVATDNTVQQNRITFYDTNVLGDNKVDHSDSGSQGSRSSLRKKKHRNFKRGCKTEFYIAGHGQETLPKSIVLYRCKIV